MGEPNRDPCTSRYWTIRTAAELVKLGVWILWQCLRHDSPTGPLERDQVPPTEETGHLTAGRGPFIRSQ